MKQIIKKPIISEKSFAESTLGKYTFIVDASATKDDLKNALSESFRVNVVSVNTANYKGKIKRTRGKLGKRSDFKRAIFMLEKGQKISLFETESEEKNKKSNDKDTNKASQKPKQENDGVVTKIRNKKEKTK